MPLKFQYQGCNWTIREGLPPMGSCERLTPTFIEALTAANPRLKGLTQHEIASWIVARLNYLTSGRLPMEVEEIDDDLNVFGYKIRLASDTNLTLAHGAVVFEANRTYFASVEVAIIDFQSRVVELLTESPNDISPCEIGIRDPKSKKRRVYGWNGYMLLT